MKKLIISLLLIIVSTNVYSYQENLFTSCNLWFENPKKMNFINYKVGNFLPAGTEVRILKIISKPEDDNGYNNSFLPSIEFETVENNAVYKIFFNEKYHPKLQITDYEKLYFTNKNIDHLLNGMTKREIYAIKRGFLVEGMSKKAVIVSYGYPAEHMTESLENMEWYYWPNRIIQKIIYFDNEGKTINVL